MSVRLSRILPVLALLATVAIALNTAIGFAQSTTTVSWTAGPSASGTANGLLLLTNTAGEGAPGTPVNASDGSTTRTATQFPDNPTDVYRYLHYRVNPTTALASYSFARVDVEYLDETTLAGSNMQVHFNSTDGGPTKASTVWQMLGTGRYQTATFHLTGVNFQSQPLGNYDSHFRAVDMSDKGIKVLRVTVVGSTTNTQTGRTEPVAFDINDSSATGLQLKSGGDGVVSFTTDCGGVVCGRTAVKVSSAGYAYLDVDNGYIANGTPGDAQVEVRYFDNGFGFFYLNYDAQPGSTPTFKDSFTHSAFDSGDTTRSDYEANNIVYLQNTRTWKSYKFNLSNVWFGNRLGNQSDIKITQARGGDRETARMGYDLRFDRVVVTKFTTPIDKTATLEGNYSGFCGASACSVSGGGPAWVWTQLGSIGALNEQGHGLFQDDATAATTPESAGGKSGRTLTGGIAYFNVNDTYLLDAAASNIKSVLVGVEYFDRGVGAFTIDYDSTSGLKSTDPITTVGGNTWKRTAFYITDGRFSNGLPGGNDFAIKVTLGANNLLVRDVAVTRTVGENRSGTVLTGYARNRKLVGVHHFPAFDGFRPALWERSTMAPAGVGETASDYVPDLSGANNANIKYSLRSHGTHTKDLTDMRDANIDLALVWYTGNSLDANTQGVVGIRKMVEAAQVMTNPPKFGLLLDPVNNKGEKIFRNFNENLNLNDPGTYGQFIKLAEDYFSLVPRSMWATIDGKPVIALYYQGSDHVTTQNPQIVQLLRERFQATHGVSPYVIADNLYDPGRSMNPPPDDFFSWGAGLCNETCVGGNAGFAQRSAFEVGPGFHDNPVPPHQARQRDRENGAFYQRGWDRAAGKGNHLVLIDTFNYWVEGAAIAESREFGRLYLDITRDSAAAHKARNFASANSVTRNYATNVVSGITQDEVPDGFTQADARGRRASGTTMLFSIDDTFVESANTPVTIRVRYVDAGPLFIDVKYDGPNGQTDAGRVVITGSGAIREAAFNVTAYLGNRLNEANDIRLDTNVAGQMVIESISVERLGASQPTPTPTAVPSQCATPPEQAGGSGVPTPVSGVLRSFLPVIFKNYCTQ